MKNGTKKQKIAFLGDSITVGCCIDNIENVYWKRLGRDAGCEVFGYGISGTRISRSQRPSKNTRDDLYFKSRLPEMIDDADIVVVFGGTNDCGHGDAPIFDLYTEWDFHPEIPENVKNIFPTVCIPAKKDIK